jgi:hypothetical protein
MTNSMPTFAVLRNKTHLGFVSAVSHAQAMKRAATLARKEGYDRFEIVACGNATLDKAARQQLDNSDLSHSKGRQRYATPGFEERRAALLAEFKAR